MQEAIEMHGSCGVVSDMYVQSIATVKFDTFQDEAHLFMMYLSSPFLCFDTIPQATVTILLLLIG